MTTPHAQKGFTIIEALVAITILIVGVTGAFTAASQGISSATFAKDQIIAFHLAQEAMEMVRNVRDTNGIRGDNWLQGIAVDENSPCATGVVCSIDVLTNVIATCGEPGSCPPLREDTLSTGAYGYNSNWPETIFTREISVAPVNGGTDEVAVTVKITWQKGIVPRSFIIRENIFNWQS